MSDWESSVAVASGQAPLPVTAEGGPPGGRVVALVSQPVLLTGAVLLAALLLLAGPGRWLWPVDPWAMAGSPMLWPLEDPQFPLGTDFMGRDLLAGLVSGARVSLGVGLVSTLLAMTVGVLAGALGAYFGGWVDEALTRLTEVFQTLPKLVLAVVLVALFKPTVGTEVLAIGLVSWTPMARLVRAQVLSLRERDFVLAARAVGMGELHLLVDQILPHLWAPVLVMGSLTLATAVQAEAALAFLGLGDPNVMSWGTVVAGGREQVLDAWYICAEPGLAIVWTVLAFNLLAEGLNDALNPALRAGAGGSPLRVAAG